MEYVWWYREEVLKALPLNFRLCLEVFKVSDLMDIQNNCIVCRFQILLKIFLGFQILGNQLFILLVSDARLWREMRKGRGKRMIEMSQVTDKDELVWSLNYYFRAMQKHFLLSFILFKFRIFTSLKRYLKSFSFHIHVIFHGHYFQFEIILLQFSISFPVHCSIECILRTIIYYFVRVLFSFSIN